MLKQFAPNVVIPPSPKKTAWISNAIDTDEHGGPRAQHHGRSPHSHRVSGSPARQGNVKHHDDKAECADHRQQRHQARVQQPLDARERHIPERYRGAVEHGAGRRAEISIGDVHAPAGRVTLSMNPARPSE